MAGVDLRPENPLPRQVWITSLTQEGITGANRGSVAAVLREFGLKTHREQITCADQARERYQRR